LLRDTNTVKRSSLGKANEDEAQQIIEAKNAAERQRILSLQTPKHISPAATTESKRESKARTSSDGNA
jgi:hypothetical protein